MIFRFLLKAILFTLLVVISLILIDKCLVYPDRADNYYGSLKDKEQRIASLGPGKIILIGGSNVAFGFNSSQISQSLGKNVCNLGVYADFPLQLYLNIALKNCKENDVVLLIPEYQYLFNKDFSKQEIFNLIYSWPEVLQYFPSSEKYILKIQFFIYKISYAIWYYVTGQYKNTSDHIYKRSNFNNLGDFVGHLNSTTNYPIVGDFSFLVKNYNEKNLEEVKDFFYKCEQQKVKCYYSFPAIEKEITNKYQNNLSNIHLLLNKEFPGKVLEHPNKLRWDSSHFYDTPYHLNKKGREKRTQQLLDALKRVVLLTLL